MDRKQKERLVHVLHETFANTSLVVVAHQTGLTVAESSRLRTQMRDAGASYKVTKNRLTRLALEGTKFESLRELFTGPTAVAVSQDPVAAAKVCVEFAKTNKKLAVVGGSLNGEMLDVDAVEQLAKLPSLDELRARLVGVITAPATKVATVTQAPAAQLARLMQAYASKDEAA